MPFFDDPFLSTEHNMGGFTLIIKILTCGAFLLFAGADTVGHLSSRLIYTPVPIYITDVIVIMDIDIMYSVLGEGSAICC